MMEFSASKSLPPWSGALSVVVLVGGLVATVMCAIFVSEAAAGVVGVGTVGAVLLGFGAIRWNSKRSVPIIVDRDMLTVGSACHPIRDVAFGVWSHIHMATGRLGTIIEVTSDARSVRFATSTAIPDAHYSLPISNRYDFLVGEATFVASLAPGLLESGPYTIHLQSNNLRTVPSLFARSHQLVIDGDSVSVWSDGARLATATWPQVGVVRTHYRFKSRAGAFDVPVVALDIPGLPEPLAIAGQIQADSDWQRQSSRGPAPRLHAGFSDWQTLMRYVAPMATRPPRPA